MQTLRLAPATEQSSSRTPLTNQFIRARYESKNFGIIGMHDKPFSFQLTSGLFAPRFCADYFSLIDPPLPSAFGTHEVFLVENSLRRLGLFGGTEPTPDEKRVCDSRLSSFECGGLEYPFATISTLHSLHFFSAEFVSSAILIWTLE